MANISTEELAAQTGISERDLLAIHMLERATVPDPQSKKCSQLSMEEQSLVTEFLERTIGNMKLNQQILAMQKHFKLQDTGIGFTVIDILKSITYKTRHWSDDRINIEMLCDRFNRFHQGEQLEEEDKISLAQYGALSDLASIFLSLTALHQAGLLASASLFSLYEKAQKANEMMSNLQERFFRDFKMEHAAVVKAKKAQGVEKAMSITQQLFDIEGNHAVVGFSLAQGGSLFSHSHVNGTKDIFSLIEFLYNDLYRIKLDKLIAPKMQDYLKQHLGDNWLQQVEKMFGEIQRDFHDSHLISPIAAKLRLHSDSMADWYGSWRHSLAGASRLPASHATFFAPEHGHGELKDMMFARKQFNIQENAPLSVLCSQFVGISLLATLNELNDHIAVGLMAKGEDEEEVPDIIVQLPINDHEVLGHFSPRRLIEALDEHGAVERITAPEDISSIIATRERRQGRENAQDESGDDDNPHL
jgi:hypothetical protein